MTRKRTKREKNRATQLKLRDKSILEHVARFRLTTVDVLHQAILVGDSPNAIAKLLNRLSKYRYLTKHTLVHPVRYYVLGEDGAAWLGLDHYRVVSLGPQALPIEYGVLLYALLGNPRRTRLMRAEILNWGPWLDPTMAEVPHCAEIEQRILELIRVDLGGPAAHLARKCVGDVTKRRTIREFLPFVADGRFRLVVVTATPEKSQAVRQALLAHEWPRGLLVHISVVPQLLILSTR
jgi:hypothetical protein